jgi:hypothetical protein
MAQASPHNNAFNILKANLVKVNHDSVLIRYSELLNRTDNVSRSYFQLNHLNCHVDELIPGLELEILVNKSTNVIEYIRLSQVDVLRGVVERLEGGSAIIAPENQPKFRIQISEIHSFNFPIEVGSFMKVFKTSSSYIGVSLDLRSRKRPESALPLAEGPQVNIPSTPKTPSVRIDTPPSSSSFEIPRQTSTISIGAILKQNVETSDKCILPISTFKSCVKNADFELLDSILADYTGWRRLGPGPNSFYRAIGVAYLEHLFRPTTEPIEVQKFITLLENSHTINLNRASRPNFLRGLRYLLDLKLSSKLCLPDLMALIEKQNFDNDLVAEMRCLAVISLNVLRNSEFIVEFLGNDINSHAASICDLNNQAEEWVLICMADILTVCIKQVTMNQKDPSYFEPQFGTAFPVLHLLNSISQFDLLYTHSQIRADRYDIYKLEYIELPLEKFELDHLKRSLYITRSKVLAIKNPPKPIVINKNEIALSTYCSDLQTLCMNQFNLLREISYQHKLRTSSFPSLSKFLRYQEAMIPLISRDIDQDENMMPLLMKENELISLYNTSEANLYLFNSCMICQTMRSDLTLDCSHSFCLGHIKDHILNITNQFVFFSNYEASYPIFCPICNTILSYEDIDKVFSPQEKQFYQQQAEIRKRHYLRHIGVRDCMNCKRDLPIQNFIEYHTCICIECHAMQLRQDIKSCNSCHMQYSDALARSFNGSYFNCYCNKRYLFRNVKDTLSCHLLCPECLLMSVEVSQCIHCSLPVRREDLDRIKPKILEQCQGCHTYQSSMKFQVDKECGCLVCLDCVISWEAADKICRVCNNPLKKPPKLVPCLVCGENIPENLTVPTLSCPCIVCVDCMKGYLENEIKEGKIVNGEINCVNFVCRTMIHPLLVERFTSPEIFSKLNEIAIFASYKITDCPQCREKFEYINNNTTCPKCNNRFCAKCMKPQHNEDCVQIQRREHIDLLIEKGEPVAQCPGCQEVYTKDDKCEHVDCINSKCKVSFCFQCACFREPTLVHGNHYHREECRFYDADYKGPDQYLPDRCFRCREKGSVCDKPPKLPRRALFIPA